MSEIPDASAALLKILTHDQIRVLTRDDVLLRCMKYHAALEESILHSLKKEAQKEF